MTLREYDNRDTDDMMKFYEARIEALQAAVAQLKAENAALSRRIDALEAIETGRRVSGRLLR